MKRLLPILFFSLILLLGCTSNDTESSIPLVDGSTFSRTSFVIQTPIDGNNDGFFNLDVLLERNCSSDNMSFNSGETVVIPTFSPILLNAQDDGSGNLSQSLHCLIADGFYPTYEQDGYDIKYYYDQELAMTGILSDDGNTITFNLKSDQIIFGTRQIVDPNGVSAQYNGDVTITYTRQ